jgi:CRP-like cAMP-binding protein
MDRFARDAVTGTVLFREGDAGHDVYVVQSGCVRLTRRIRGRDHLIADMGAGEVFGEMSILNDKPRAATATVVEDAHFLVLDPRTFEAMIKANTEIAVRIIKKLSKRLDDANAQIESLLVNDPTQPVVRALLELAVASSTPPAVGVSVAVTPSALAARAGVTEFEANAAIERMVRASVVSQVTGGLRVPDVTRLHAFLEAVRDVARAGPPTH